MYTMGNVFKNDRKSPCGSHRPRPTGAAVASIQAWNGIKTVGLGLCLIVLCLGAMGTASAAEPQEFKIYSIGYADSSNAVDVVRAVIAEDGKVFFDSATHQLMVLTSSNHHAAVEKVVKQLNVPPRNVRVEVTFRGRGSDTRKAASVTGEGDVVLGRHGNRTSVRIQPRVENSLTDTSSLTRQQLLVSSGRQASIFVGEDVPYIEWLMEYGRRYHYMEQRLAWQRVGAYLVIEPTVLGTGPMIRIRLIPELSGLVDNNPYRTRFANVTTEVTVSDGVPFALGGLTQENEFYSRFLIGVDRSGARQTLDIELIAHIVPADAPAK